MRGLHGAFFLVAALSLSACDSSLDLAKNRSPSDAEITSCLDVQDSPYPVSYLDTYKGDHTLKSTVVVSACYGRQFGRPQVQGGSERFADGLVRGFALGMAKRGMTVTLSDTTRRKLGLKVDIEKQEAKGSLTAKLSERKEDVNDRAMQDGIKGFSNVDTFNVIGSYAPGYVDGTVHITTLHGDDEEVEQLSRALEVDALVCIIGDVERAKVQFVVPLAKLKTAAPDGWYPVDFNHMKTLELRYSGVNGSMADGEMVGELLARAFRLYYPS